MMKSIPFILVLLIGLSGVSPDLAYPVSIRGSGDADYAHGYFTFSSSAGDPSILKDSLTLPDGTYIQIWATGTAEGMSPTFGLYTQRLDGDGLDEPGPDPDYPKPALWLGGSTRYPTSAAFVFRGPIGETIDGGEVIADIGYWYNCYSNDTIYGEVDWYFYRTPVPEPATLLLLGSGLIGLLAGARHKMKKL